MDSIEHITSLFLELSKSYMYYKKFGHQLWKKIRDLQVLSQSDHHEWLSGCLSDSAFLILFVCLCHKKNDFHIGMSAY